MKILKQTLLMFSLQQILIAVGQMIIAIDTFLQCYFIVIVAVWTTAIDLLIARAWSNVSLCCFGLSAIFPFHFPPFSFSNSLSLSLLLALRKNPHTKSFTDRHQLPSPPSAVIKNINCQKPNRFDEFVKPTAGGYQILNQQGVIMVVVQIYFT